MGHLLPLIVGSGFFGALFIFMPCFVKKGPYQGIIRCSMLLAVFSMWIFWATVYISQMNPLVGPRHKNTTLVFWRYKDGVKAPAKPAAIGGRSKVNEMPSKEHGKNKTGLRERMDHCQDQPDNMFECCNIPWLPWRARDKCFQEPVNVFKLKCAEARCAFQEVGWVVHPGEVKMTELNAFYNDLVETNQDWSEAVRLIETQCLQIKPKFQSIYTNCVEFDIMYCALIRMLKHGPLDNWSTADACAATRQFVAICPICPEDCSAQDLGQYPDNVCRACMIV